jgi:hypothetical protein
MFERGSEFREGASSPLSLSLPSLAKNPLVCLIKQAGEGLGVRYKR